jgi:hypothetical protein
MAKKIEEIKELKIERPPRAKVSEEESLRRMQEFQKRKERLVAAVRESQN